MASRVAAEGGKGTKAQALNSTSFSSSAQAHHIVFGVNVNEPPEAQTRCEITVITFHDEISAALSCFGSSVESESLWKRNCTVHVPRNLSIEKTSFRRQTASIHEKDLVFPNALGPLLFDGIPSSVYSFGSVDY